MAEGSQAAVRPADDPVVSAYHGVSRTLTAAGGPFETVGVAVGGRSVRVFAGVPVTVGDLLVTAELRLGGALFLQEEGRATSYAELFAAAARFAAVLHAEHAIGSGDRVGILMRNRAEWLVAFLAAMRLGAVAVLFPSRSVGDELAAAVRQVPCRVVVADDERIEQLGRAAVAAAVIGLADILRLEPEPEALPPPPSLDGDAPAAILFTSGTSGGARAAILTHRNLVNMDRNVAYITALSTGIEAELMEMTADALAASSPRPMGLLLFPFFHVSGLTAFFRTLAAGGEMVLMRRWDPAAALALIEAHGVTMLSGPPLVLSDLLDQPGAAERLSSLNALVIGGQAILPGLVERAARALPRAAFSIGWGMTEVSGAVTAAVGSLCRARPPSCGVLLPLTDIRICSDDGHPLPSGQTGELMVGGALVMQGYFGAEEATAAVLSDGWLHTGDIGRVDEDGFVYLVDRKKDIVICGGENVYCGEVERVLGGHPDVGEALVFGVLDARTGERLVAAVTLRDGSTCTAADLIEATRPHLAAFKIPSEIVFDLPMAHNATGKVSKAELRAALLRREAANGRAA